MLSEEVRLRRLHTLWLHSHDILEQAKLQGWRVDLWLLRIKGRGRSDYKGATGGSLLWSRSNGTVPSGLCWWLYNSVYLPKFTEQYTKKKKKVDFAICKLNDLKVKKYISQSQCNFWRRNSWTVFLKDLQYLLPPFCSMTDEPRWYPNNLLLVFVALLLFLICRQTFHRILSVYLIVQCATSNNEKVKWTQVGMILGLPRPCMVFM